MRLDSLNPASAPVGTDVTLHVLGDGFRRTSQIVFNHGLEATTFVSDKELTTLVKLSGPGTITPGTYPIEVRDGARVFGPLDFTIAP